MDPTEELKRLPKQGVVLSNNGNVGWKTVEVGSMWRVPSTT